MDFYSDDPKFQHQCKEGKGCGLGLCRAFDVMERLGQQEACIPRGVAKVTTRSQRAWMKRVVEVAAVNSMVTCGPGNPS